MKLLQKTVRLKPSIVHQLEQLEAENRTSFSVEVGAILEKYFEKKNQEEPIKKELESIHERLDALTQVIELLDKPAHDQWKNV